MALAKSMFMRLQGAWDRNEQGDLFELTTPEMFAQIKRDLESRGSEPNRTEVPQLDAEVLGVDRPRRDTRQRCAFTVRCAKTAQRLRSRSRRCGTLSAAHRATRRGGSRAFSSSTVKGRALIRWGITNGCPASIRTRQLATDYRALSVIGQLFSTTSTAPIRRRRNKAEGSRDSRGRDVCDAVACGIPVRYHVIPIHQYPVERVRRIGKLLMRLCRYHSSQNGIDSRRLYAEQVVGALLIRILAAETRKLFGTRHLDIGQSHGCNVEVERVEALLDERKIGGAEIHRNPQLLQIAAKRGGDRLHRRAATTVVEKSRIRTAALQSRSARCDKSSPPAPAVGAP